MLTTYIIAGIIAIGIIWLCLAVTKKAYSRKWEDDEN